MNLTKMLTNNQFKRLLSFNRNIEDRIKSADSSLTDILYVKYRVLLSASQRTTLLLGLA